jgi:hypothetical protein
MASLMRQYVEMPLSLYITRAGICSVVEQSLKIVKNA